MSDKTTELREKLIERGVKYRTTEVHGMPVTLFDDGILTWSVTDHPDGYMILNCGGLTPDQAIAATLGSGLNPDGLPNGLTISDDGTLLNWHGVNYVKQSTFGSGTCENISDPPSGFLCSECGWGDFNEPSHLLTTAKFTDNDNGPNHCPNCGRRVER